MSYWYFYTVKLSAIALINSTWSFNLININLCGSDLRYVALCVILTNNMYMVFLSCIN